MLSKKPKTTISYISSMIACLYTPLLMTIVYLIPDGMTIISRSISYEFWYFTTLILLFAFAISPIIELIKYWRNKYVR